MSAATRAKLFAGIARGLLQRQRRHACLDSRLIMPPLKPGAHGVYAHQHIRALRQAQVIIRKQFVAADFFFACSVEV